MRLPVRAAIDIGGTFTDLFLVDYRTNQEYVVKVPSTPPDYSVGILDALQQAGVAISEIDLLVHGTTAHLNALLERKGARIGLVTTEGFGDVYKIARGNRAHMYDLHYSNPIPLVPRFLVQEVRERIGPQGDVVIALEDGAASRLGLERLDIEAVAICLLNSYTNSAHEEALAAEIRSMIPSLDVYPSFEICSEWREYERTSTTVLNAYVSPILSSYLGKLRSRLSLQGFEKPVFLMQSNGGLIESTLAERLGALTLMSGPVGGAVGCVRLAEELGEPNLIAIDMGGTSFDFALVMAGTLLTTSEREVAGFPLLAPSIDIHTIGAGGGSIAWLESGALRVGPRSAGAVPGPACYGHGGTEPTVTDANVVLGRLPSIASLGSDLPLSELRAVDAIRAIAEPLGLDVNRMAEGIINVVNAKMANAMRSITIGRGIDPRDFALVAYGGAGPLHAAALAEELGICRVLVPGAPGVFSARGMLQADIRHEDARTVLLPLIGQTLSDLQLQFEDLETGLSDLLQSEGIQASCMTFRRSLDMRYVGQEYFINVPLPYAEADLSTGEIKERFGSSYDRQYGHKNLAEDVEIVNIRAEGEGCFEEGLRTGLAGSVSAEAGGDRGASPKIRRVTFSGAVWDGRVLTRAQLRLGRSWEGPLIIEEDTCTTLVPPGWDVEVGSSRSLVLTRHD